MSQDISTQVIEVEDLDLAQLMALEIGDTLEMPPLMPTLSQEPVVAVVASKDSRDGIDMMELRLSYYGAFLCKATLTLQEGNYIWL